MGKTIILGEARWDALRAQLAEREGLTDEQRKQASKRIDEEAARHTIELAVPASYALCAEIWVLAMRNSTRGAAAALGACWQTGNHPGIPYAQCGHDPRVYGQRVLDVLAERGYTLGDILDAGHVAVEMLRDRVHPVREVDELAAFIGAPAA